MASSPYLSGYYNTEYREAHTPSPRWSTHLDPNSGEDIFRARQNVVNASKSSIQPLIFDYESGILEPKKRPATRDSFWYNWRMSIISLFISVCAIIAIIVLLVKVDGTALPKLLLGITVNSCVSFFVTLAKTCMLVPVAECIGQLKWLWFQSPRKLQDIQIFDDASRGPMGSLRLIFSEKGIRLVAIGGLITVLAMVMDPFTQQIVYYPTRNVAVGNATVGGAQAFPTDEGESSQLSPSPALKSAIYAGLLTPSSSNDLNPTCSTGTCTFPLFESLSFCTKCLNVTDLVINTSPSSLRSAITNDPTNPSGPYNITFTLPGPTAISFPASFSSGLLTSGPNLYTTTNLPQTLSETLLNLQNPLLTLAILQFPTVNTNISEGNYFSSPPITNICALYLCINTYNITVSASLPNTTVISSWVPEFGTPIPSSQDDLADAPPIVLQPTNTTNDTAIQNQTYTLTPYALANLQTYLNTTLSGSLPAPGTSANNPTNNDILQALNTTLDPNPLFNSLANSMSSYLSSSASVSASDIGIVEGRAWSTETYVKVQYPWLALPLLLIVGAGGFLLVTVVVNWRKEGLVWKNDSLALLFHGIEGMGSERDRVGEGLSGMDEIAKRMMVRLGRVEGEWKLVGVGVGEGDGI